jgi:serine/threonine protein kinase
LVHLIRVSDLRAALEAALGPIYRVEREVRPVGNCRMFVALGPPDGPELLVKVLPAELSLALSPDVFERELILVADRLGHPQLVAHRRAGRAGAFIYHTRRFVVGTTLRASLARSGELPLRRAIEILRDILTALAHAHAAGVVHGDLKPENVLLTDQQTMLADTGVVTAVARALPSTAAGAASAALCAVPYLPPERRDGGVPAGPRDDMFAVGVLVHEMLTGGLPGAAESLEEVRAVPQWLVELARRCLAAQPDGRWPEAAAALATIGRPSRGAA